ncbi:hypothetical protein M433DRAFT_8500 [Acidomyces richmondensis BFW]|nr:hypothetical protein M433DRAFT_8500 [Acidomyces richmondensis BFW]
MSSRLYRSSQSVRRKYLAQCIERNGTTMLSPCTECVRRMRKYYLVVTRTEFDKLRSIRLRLKEQLERVEDKEEKLVEEQEALLARIRTE